jgi:CrcB protein
MTLIVILVALGGALGSVSRFGIMQVGVRLSQQLPLGVLFCNIVGSFVIGMVAAFFIKTNLFSEEMSVYLRTFAVTGFLGGFTTFSSFSLDVLLLFQKGEVITALCYMIISVLVSLVMVAVGFYFIFGVYK